MSGSPFKAERQKMKIKIKVNKDRVMKKTAFSVGDKTFHVSPLSFAEARKLTSGGTKPFDWDMNSDAFLEQLYTIVTNHSDVTEADLEALTIDEVSSVYLKVMELTYQVKNHR
jgi:hypothetical protein